MSNKGSSQKNHYNSDDSDEYENTMPVSDETESTEVIDSETMQLAESMIYPGLVLKNEYVLLKKIGHGNNATVWIAYYIPKKSYIALKVQDEQCYHDGCREVVIIKRINEFCKANSDKNYYCVKMLDFFVYEEDTGEKFVCSSYDLYAGSVQMLLDGGKYKYGLPIHVVKTIVKQLLTALSIMHGELKIIHTDIKPENVLFKGIPEYQKKIMDLFEASGFEQKYHKLCETYGVDSDRFNEELEILALDSIKEINSVIFEDNNDEELIPDEDDLDEDGFIEGEDDECDEEYDESDESEVDSSEYFNERQQSVNDIIEHLDYSEIHDLEEDGEYDFVNILNNRENTSDHKEVIDDMYVLNCETAVTDFGNSYFYEKRTRNEIQDRRYRAPEIVLDLNYGYACDIWSVACVTFELLTGFVLFEPLDEPLNKDLHHLYLMEVMLGSMPLKMKKASKRNKFLFDKKRNYHIKNVDKIRQVGLRERLEMQFLFSESDATEISDFLLCGLRYDPTERWSAKELLNHPWLKK